MIAADGRDTEVVSSIVSARPRLVGTLLGIVAFLAGVGLVAWAFWLAYGLFSRPPEIAIGLKPGEPLDFGGVANALVALLVRAVMLVLMAGAGSAIANRGVRLYSASGARDRDATD